MGEEWSNSEMKIEKGGKVGAKVREVDIIFIAFVSRVGCGGVQGLQWLPL